MTLFRGYPRAHSYAKAKDSQSWPDFPGAALDGDFNKLHAALNGLGVFFSSVGRLGRRVRNGIVSEPKLNPEIRTGFRRPVFWAPGRFFPAGSTVLVLSAYYFTTQSHISGASFVADRNKWNLIVGETSAPVTDDNFRDVQDPARAREYLGLGSMALHFAGEGLVQYRDNALNEQRFMRRALNLADVADKGVFLENLGLADFVTSESVDQMISPSGILGRASAGQVRSVALGAPFAISGGALRQKPALLADNDPQSGGVVTPAFFHDLLNDEAFTQFGEGIIPGVTFGALRMDYSAYARHEPPFNAPQTALTPGGWRTRPLTELSGYRIDADLANSQIRLPAGAFFVECRFVNHAVSGGAAVLVGRFSRVARLVDDLPVYEAGPEIVGTVDGTGDGPHSLQTVFRGLIVNDAEGLFELQQRNNRSVTPGVPVNLATTGVGIREKYSEVRIWQLNRAPAPTFTPFTFADKISKIGSAAIVYQNGQIARQHISKVSAAVLLESE